MIEQMMKFAYLLAAQSPDPSNQNGAVVLSKEGKVLSVGFNGFGKVKVSPSMTEDRETKLAYIEHAERAALFDLIEASRQHDVTGSIMICPWAACCDCARAIARMGVKKVVVHGPRMRMTPDRWQKSVGQGICIMDDYGVECEVYNEPIQMPEGFYIMVNGEKWSPSPE